MKAEFNGDDDIILTAERVSGHVRISIRESEIILDADETKKLAATLKVI